MNVDRRQNLRKEPEKFAFIQLDRDDGGAVLNISEGGLSFSTFAPVDQKGPIHFWFSLNLNERIDAWGEVAWTDDSKKLGGLRFIRLPERAERQIREWISRPISRESPNERYTPQAAGGHPSRGAAKEPDTVARFVSKARSKRAPVLASSEDSGVSDAIFPPLGEIGTTRFVPKARPQRAPILSSSILSNSQDPADSSAAVSPAEVASTGELVPMQRYRSEKRRQFIRGLLAGICISAAVAGLVIKYSNSRHENKGLGKAPAELSAQKSPGEASPPEALKTSSESSNAANSSKSGNPKKDVAVSRKPSILASETGGHPGPGASETPATSPSSRAPVAANLSGNSSPQKRVMTPQQLWASVQAGNPKAAVALAELYIKGEGVPQNCDQARVLLLMASEKRNAEAIKRLHELDQTGCPQN